MTQINTLNRNLHVGTNPDKYDMLGKDATSMVASFNDVKRTYHISQFAEAVYILLLLTLFVY